MTSNTERKYRCPEHGLVDHGERQHGGRSEAFTCEHCNHTVSADWVDWGAYERAMENGEYPPCPDCGSDEIEEYPVSRENFHCQGCGHRFGYAGAYK